ncbi:UNKNOWN [Stylonychia lemnae]|uniref:Cyclin N-terminal domain-containing protein n=1 Tax=Stylonychia lemnae TaxID=5949 RepID=A0A077ZT27_STYLE|nr:UNKNOWN [Stylonychia lemnae]|eukprot:CDW72709.1 UNKNOWN [Stylonychia lemnae]
MTPSMANESQPMLDNFHFGENNHLSQPLQQKSLSKNRQYLRKQSSGRRFNKEQIQALAYCQDAIVEEDSQNMIIDGEYIGEDDQNDLSEVGGEQGFLSIEDFQDFDDYEQVTKSEAIARIKLINHIYEDNQNADEEEYKEVDEEQQKKIMLQHKYERINEQMEENEKKRKDPNRDFIINEGNLFLSAIKFSVQNEYKKPVNEIMQQEKKNDKEADQKEFEDSQRRKQSLRDHFLILDRSIHQSRRIYMSMPGSLQPSIVTTILNYRPKIKQKQKKYPITSSSSDSFSDSSSSSSSESDMDRFDTDSDDQNDSFNINSSRDEQQLVKGIALPSRSSSMSSLDNQKNSSSSDSKSSSQSSGRDGYAKYFRIKEQFNFEPLYLDEQKLGYSKHKHEVSLSSYKRKKDDLNRMFKKSHPQISKNLTLSKIMSLKHRLISVFLLKDDPLQSQKKKGFRKDRSNLNAEVYSLAVGWVLFEKLIYKGLVKKSNRRIIAAMCLFISVKNNQVYGGYENNEKFFSQFKQDLNVFLGDKQSLMIKRYELKRQEYRRVISLFGKRKHHHHKHRRRFQNAQNIINQRKTFGASLALTSSAPIYPPGYKVAQKRTSVDSSDDKFSVTKNNSNKKQLAFNRANTILGQTKSAPSNLSLSKNFHTEA